jgi:ATP-binding cassette, subfamily F, member 3
MLFRQCFDMWTRMQELERAPFLRDLFMISATNISLRTGGKVLYKDASFQIKPGEKAGLVGPNGVGKSSLFRLITGQSSLEQGEVTMPNRWTIGLFSQDVGEMRGNSILEEVQKVSAQVKQLAAVIKECEGRLDRLGDEPMDDDALATLLDRYGNAQEEFERRGGYNLDHLAQEILTGLGFDPADLLNPVESLSGGWKMRVELAKILLLNPDVLLMDEPTNHLDVESIMWLEQWLQEFKGALLMTSHDREFMNRIVKKIIEIDNGAITTYSGNYDFYEKDREIRREQLIASHKRQQEMLAKEEEFIAKFAARASHAAQVNSRVKKIEKIERIELPTERRTVKFEFPEPPRSGDEAVILNSLSKTWIKLTGEKLNLFGNVTAVVRRLSRVAIVGVNGAGKSTLLKCICGEVEPTQGEARLGANIEVGYFSQHAIDILNPNQTVFDCITEVIPRASIGTVRSLLGCFLFSDDDVQKKISVLSGGEKSRVLLARILARPTNLLVLDEPTNHLDIQSREILLEALQRYQGTILIVSHDRHFQKALATQVYEIDRGSLRVYQGRYDEYLEKCEEESRSHFQSGHTVTF